MANFDFLQPNPDWHLMRSKSELPELLYLSSSSVRNLARRYIFQSPLETKEMFEKRISEAILIPFFSRTIDTIVNKTFENGMKFDDWGIREKNWLSDINYLGLNATTFFRIFYRNAWIYGLNHVLVSFPRNPASNSYPFLVEITPDRLMNWEFTEGEDGKPLLSSIVYIDMNRDTNSRIQLVLEDNVLFERIWTNVSDSKSKEVRWEMTSETQILGFDGQPLNRIPLFTFYVNYISPMVGFPPLEELAMINIQHFRSYSLYSNLLDFINTPFLLAKGLIPDTMESIVPTNDEPISRPNIDITANDFIFTPNTDAEISYVEHTGTSLNVALERLKYLEASAEKASYEILSTNLRSGNITATEVLLDSGKTLTTIQHSAELFNAFLDKIFAEGYNLFVDPTRTTIGKLSVVVPTLISSENFDKLLVLYDKGLIPETLVINMAKKQGIIPDDWEFPS